MYLTYRADCSTLADWIVFDSNFSKRITSDFTGTGFVQRPGEIKYWATALYLILSKHKTH